MSIRLKIHLHLHRLCCDRRGATLPMVAIATSVLVGAGAVAVDAARLYASRGELQATADAAGRSAAWEIPNATATAQTAIDYAEQMMNPSVQGHVLATEDVTLGSWNYVDRVFTAGNTGANAVRLVTQRASGNANPVQLIFASVFGDDAQDVAAEAIATKIDITACVLALQQSGTGLEFNGGVEVNSPQCGLAANSLDPNAALLTEGGAGNVSIQSLYLGGGMEDPNGIIHSTEQPVVNGRRQFDDPYAERDYTDLPTSTSTTSDAVSAPNTSVTLEPGVYPSGFTFKGDVTMEPGVYVMQGDVDMTSQANVVGDGVSIVLDNSDINVDGGATTDISAPTSGSTAGIAMMRQGTASTSTLAGGASMSLTGAIYMPNSVIDYAGTSDPGGCLQLLAQRVVFRGDTNFESDCSTVPGTEDLTMSFTMLVD